MSIDHAPFEGLGENQFEGGTEGDKEKEKIPWQEKIILERHGDYFNPRAGTPEFEQLEKEGKIGLLTEKGIKETEEAARPKIREIMESGEPVDIIVFHSPSGRVEFATPKGKMPEGYGKRGEDTAEVNRRIILEEARESIGLEKEGELTEEQAAQLEKKVRIIEFSPLEKLKEADVFHKTYISGLEELFGEKFKWLEDYYNGKASKNNIMKLLRKKSGTENVHHVAQRIEELVSDLVELASEHRKKFGDSRKLVIWAVTHQAPLRAYIEHGLGAPEEDTAGYQPKNNAMIEINITPKGEAIAEFEGKRYAVE